MYVQGPSIGGERENILERWWTTCIKQIDEGSTFQHNSFSSLFPQLGAAHQVVGSDGLGMKGFIFLLEQLSSYSLYYFFFNRVLNILLMNCAFFMHDACVQRLPHDVAVDHLPG